MDLAVTLGAFGCHDLLNRVDLPNPVVEVGFEAGVKMHVMALKTDERLILLQQVICNSSVRVMANRAVFCDRRVLEDKGAFLVSMTFETEIVDPLLRFEHPAVGGGMRVMATRAVHLPLSDRMVRRHIGFPALFLVALITEIRIPFHQ